jgi:chloramphenicol O-acetyltransferase
MENQSKNYVQFAIKWGLILGALRMLLDVLIKILDLSPMVFSASTFIGFLLEIIIVFIAIKSFRDKINNGNLKLVEGVKIGVIIMLITGVFYFISTSFFMPEVAIQKSMQILEQYNPDLAETMAEKVESAQESPNYILSFFSTLLWFSFLGSLISLISSLILKRNKDNELI